jgi:hypothetical protein
MTETAEPLISKREKRHWLNIAIVSLIFVLATVLPYMGVAIPDLDFNPVFNGALTVLFLALPFYFATIIIAEVVFTRRLRREQLPETLPARWVPYTRFMAVSQMVGSLGQAILVGSVLLGIVATVLTLGIAAFLLLLALPAFFGVAAVTMIATLRWRLSYGAHVAEAWVNTHTGENTKDLLNFNRVFLYVTLGLGIVATGLLMLLTIPGLIDQING